MRNLKIFLLCLAMAWLLLPSCKESTPAKNSKYYNIGKAMEREFLYTRDPFLNTVPTHRLLEAKEAKDLKLQRFGMLRQAVPGINWEERGPQNVGGRTRALIFDLSDAANGYRKVWAGGVSGGLWVCNDITATTPIWNKINDLFDNLAVSSIIQDPFDHNTLYFGTGEGWFNVDAVQGAGIWKSSDGGESWNRLSSTENFYYVQDLAIDANGALYASLRAPGSGGQSGLVKSTDGGMSWILALSSPVASNNRAADIEIAANGDIYVSMGTTFDNGGIYRSSYSSHTINTGNPGTWTNITPNATGQIRTPGNFWNRIELATAPSDPDRVYAVFQQFGTQDCSSIQQYNAATNTWTVRTVPRIIDQGSNSWFTRGQAFYNLIAAVDPNNADILYIGGVDALRSVNAGANWTQMTSWSLFAATGFTADQNVHADHHAIVYAPESSSRILWGTDGGVYYTENGNIGGSAKPVFRAKNNGFNITQYYSGAIHPTLTNYFLGGTQDNGSHRFTNAGINNVTEVSGGDGGFCFIDQDNPQLQITSYTYNNYYISTNGGSGFSSRSFNNFGQFINPADYASTQNILYAGHKEGNYFRWVAPHSGSSSNDSVRVTAFGNTKISHVKASALTPNRVYFGLENGSLIVVDDAHTGTTKAGRVLKTGLGVVSSLALDPIDENHMLITYSNYGVTSVFESFDALAGSPTWIAVEGDLPDMPVRWAIFDPRSSDWAILATELGVWSTNDLNGAETKWNPTNSGLANVRVDMLQLRPSDGTIMAATHGRGIFTAQIPSVTTPDINFSSAASIVTETSTGTDDCRGYQDITVRMTIANPISGEASINLSVVDGTAAAGIDFSFTTNGDFDNPSQTLVLEDGSSSPVEFIFRVYDDAEVEAEEWVRIGYTISGNSDAQAGIGNQSHTLTIIDNDQAPIGASSGSYLLTAPDLYYLSSADAAPLNSKYSSMRSQFLYRAEELVAAGLTSGTINELSIFLLKNSTRPFSNLQIRLGTTTNDNLIESGSVLPATTSLVYSASSYTTVDEFNTFEFDTPFQWNGIDNIVVDFCYQNATADSTETSDVIIGYSDGGTSTQANFFWARNAVCDTWQFVSSTFYGGYKPIAIFGANMSGTSIASMISSVDKYLPPSADLFLYTNSGSVMARIKNLSTVQNYGCFNIAIDRAGTGAKPFWNNNNSNQVMEKTLRVIPDQNFSDGNYEITLYYTAEEVAGWEAATGQSFDNILLIKTKGSVSAITPNNPGAEGEVEIVTPVRGSFGTGRTLRFSFNSGFSGFAAGVVGNALPVELAEFTATAENQKVLLNWKTASEFNNEGFAVERSADSRQFIEIGYRKSAGNSVQTRTYSFTDDNPLQGISYYRLRQIDIDGTVSYSKVATVRMQLTDKAFRVLQNPVKTAIDIQVSGLAGADFEAALIDLNGKVLSRWKLTSPENQVIRLQLPSQKIARGAYILQLRAGVKTQSERIIIH